MGTIGSQLGATGMNFGIRARLSAMMFLEYFVWGAWYVTVGTWLGESLHFSGQQIGLIAGTTAIGAIASPFFIGLIADRLFATQKVLGILHAVGAVLLWSAAGQHTFTPLYVLVLAYAVCYMPTLALTNSLAFRQMADPKLEFGLIRVLGTAGWIFAGLLIGGFRLEATAVPIRLAAASSLALAIYSFTLPDTPPLAARTRLSLGTIFPPETFRLFREPAFLVFALASFLICVPLQFYYAFTNLFLNQIGLHNAAGKMTGGQASELLCMLLIPWFFRRLGVKYMLAAGMAAWALRYLCFAFGNPGGAMGLLWAGILLHGICYDFFFVTGQIYIDQKSPVALRAAAQGMITLITYGAGMLLGSWLSGRVVDAYATTVVGGVPQHDWRAIWLVPAIFSSVVMVVFLAVFSNRRRPGSAAFTQAEAAAATAPPGGATALP